MSKTLDYDALAAKLDAAERRERQLLDTTATCRMLRREFNTLKATLAEVEAERDAFASNIPDAAQNLIRNAHTGRLKALHRAFAAEAERDAAMRAVDENWITHQRVVAAEAALPAVYRLAMEDAAEKAERNGASPELNVANGGPEWFRHAKRIAAALRKEPIPTAAELMARIQTGEKE